MWAFIPAAPGTGYPCARDMAASTSDCSWPSRAFTPAALLNSTPTPKPRWSQEWWVDICPVLPSMAPDLRDMLTPPQRNGAPDLSGRPRCGATCEPSSVMAGVVTSTRSLRVTLASRSAPPANVVALMMSGTYGPTLPGSPEKSPPNGCSSKTSPGMSASALKPCCETYGTWASRLRLAYSRRAKLARRMNGSGCSSWPTAKAVTGGANSQREARGAGGPDLQEAAQNWPTPMAGTPAQNGNNAAGNSDFSRKAEELARGLWGTPRGSDGAKGGPNQKFGAGGIPLPAQAAQWQTPVADDRMDRDRGKFNSRGEPKLSGQAQQWPTPASRDHKGENSADHLTNGTGRKHMDQLPNAVAHAFTLPALPRQTDGPSFLARLRISRQLRAYVIASHGRATWRRLLKGRAARRLNPGFVEWLMGWPPGHALCAASETAFTHWQQDMRGALSQLPTASAPWIWMPKAEATPAPIKQLNLF